MDLIRKRAEASVLSAVACAAGIAILAGCGSARPRVTCAIAPAASGVPYLVRAAQLGSAAIPPADSPPSPVCKRSPRYKCHPVDELDAVLRGGADVPSAAGQSFVRACPNVPAKVSLEKPWRAEKPCGDAAADNTQLIIESGDMKVHVLFYDDPGCREPVPGQNQPLRQAPYYRAGEVVAIEWQGEGW